MKNRMWLDGTRNNRAQRSKDKGDGEENFESSQGYTGSRRPAPMQNHGNRTTDYSTGQVPIDIKVKLFAGKPPRLIKKLKKEVPELAEGSITLLKASEILKAKRILVRENSTGIVPVLLALSFPGKSIVISTWSTANHGAILKNVEENFVEGRCSVVVEGTRIEQKGNVGILIHEAFQSQDTILQEVSLLLEQVDSGTVFIVSHKSKGIETLITKMEELGLSPVIVSRGSGGVRVVKVSRAAKVNQIGVLKAITYKIRRVTLTFQTGYSLFSPDQVDVGTDLLIRYVLSTTGTGDSTEVYDLACGYGAIGLSLARVMKNVRVTMSDVNARATDVASLNANNLGLSDRVKVILSDGPERVTGQFDLVVSNPPLHISRDDLVRIIVNSWKRLKKGGKLILVVEDSQVKNIKELLYPYIGYLTEAKKSKTHFILEKEK